MGVFDDIYKSNRWGFGSGHGSLPSVTKSYRKFLEDFIKENNIKSVVDYGCGDWQFSRLIDWGDAAYTGLDIVPSVVEQNTKLYGNKKVSFKAINPGTTNLPKADLLITKDVLQHLSEDEIQAFLRAALPKFKYALITNCILPTEDINKQIANGEFRPLDLRSKPFGVSASVVHTFVGPKSFSWSTRKMFPAWKKLVLLVDNTN
jgi:SAM-dependent methyltransferase